MKNKLLIVLLLLFSFFMFNNTVNAEEINNNDLEYLDVSIRFIDDTDYYITYKFKPVNVEEPFELYINFGVVYYNSIEHNLEIFKPTYDKKVGSANAYFKLDENKEYYITYKKPLRYSYRDKNLLFDIDPIYKGAHFNSYIKDYAVKVGRYSVTIISSNDIKITKDSFTNYDGFEIVEEGKNIIAEWTDKHFNYLNLIFEINLNTTYIELPSKTIYLLYFCTFNIALSIVLLRFSKYFDNDKLWILEYISFALLLAMLIYITSAEKLEPLRIFTSIFVSGYISAIVIYTCHILRDKYWMKNTDGWKKLMDPKKYNPFILWMLRIILFGCIILFEMSDALPTKNIDLLSINIFVIINTIIPGILHHFGPLPKPGPEESDGVPVINEDDE